MPASTREISVYISEVLLSKANDLGPDEEGPNSKFKIQNSKFPPVVSFPLVTFPVWHEALLHDPSL